MKRRVVLVVEDELPIRSMVRYALEVANFIVREAGDTQDADQRLALGKPDLIVLDWMLPNQDGIDYVRHLKENTLTRDIPLIMLTAKSSEDDKVLGLNTGADDYIVKPFSPRELVARVKAVLRRGPLVRHSSLLRLRELVIDTTSHRVMIADKVLRLGPLEYRLLCFLMMHNDRVFTRDELLSRVWGENAYVDERTVDVHIRRLRKHLSPGNHDALIQTIHGAGYRFSDEKTYAS